MFRSIAVFWINFANFWKVLKDPRVRAEGVLGEKRVPPGSDPYEPPRFDQFRRLLPKHSMMADPFTF